MTDLFLRANHWQLFIFGFGATFISLFVMIFSSILSGGESEIRNISYFSLIIYQASMVWVTLFAFGWAWSIAIGLGKTIPQRIKPNLRRFKTMAIIPFTYCLLIYTFIIHQILYFEPNILNPHPILIVTIILLHLLSLVGIFYCMYFTAKTIKLADTQREVRTEEVIGEFFCIWFFPIGIWIIQPKVNMIHSKMTQPPPLPLRFHPPTPPVSP